MSDDAHLRDLLDDAVGDVEPTDRLDAIRARTAGSTRRPRRGWYAVGGAVLAAAAVVVAVAVVTTGDGDERPPVATEQTPTGPSTATTPVYYLGPGPDGPDAPEAALYRYFEPAGDPLDLLMGTPTDPDYRTAWPEGSLLSYEVGDDEIVVSVADEITGAELLAWQQVVYTLQAVVGSRLPVRFENPRVDLGDIPRSPDLDVLSHMSISDPGEDFAFAGSFTARGLSNGFEASVACSLRSTEGATRHGPFVGQADGWLEDRLYPWELEVDLRGVAPGDYELECTTDDPTGGAEGAGAWTDTRTITVE